MGRDRRGGRDRPARRRERRRGEGGGPPEHRAGRHRLRHPGAAGRARLRPGLLPGGPGRQRRLRGRADLGELLPRDPGGDDRLHRHRDHLQPVGGGARPLPRHPALHPPGRGRRLRHLLHPAGDRALGPSGLGGPRRVQHPLASLPRRAASPTTRSWGSSTTSGWRAASSASEVYVGVLAATILFIAANAGVIGGRASPTRWPATGSSRALPPPAPPLQDAVARAGAVRGRGPIVAILPGETEFLGTMYSFGAMLSFTVAHVALGRAARAPPRRGARLPRAPQRAPPRRRLAAVRDPRRARDRPGVASGGHPGAGHAVGGPRLAGARVRRLPSSTAAACCACRWPRPSAPRWSC